jgi:hypothetical protein
LSFGQSSNPGFIRGSQSDFRPHDAIYSQADGTYFFCGEQNVSPAKSAYAVYQPSTGSTSMASASTNLEGNLAVTACEFMGSKGIVGTALGGSGVLFSRVSY